MNLSTEATETIVGDALGISISLDAPPKSFKDLAWALTGTLQLEGGDTVELSDAACLGESIPTPEQDAEGKWALQVASASAGALSLTLTLTGPKDFKLEAALQHTVVPLPTPQELLEKAVAAGDEQGVAKLLGDAEAAWSWEHSKTGVPLFSLLGSAQLEEEARLRLLQMLLDAGACVPARPPQRLAPPSALHAAIYAGEARMLAALLARASPEELAAQAVSPRSERVGFTPLHACCEIGDAQAAALLLARGVAIEGPRGTPSCLALCLERADLGLCRLLLDTTREDAAARARALGLATLDAAHSALALANAAEATSGAAAADEAVRFLLDEEAAVAALTFSPKPAEPEAEALLSAAAHGLHVVVRQLILRGVPAATPHPDGRSALHDAVAGGHLATARVLLDHGADPNQRASGVAAEAELPLGLAICLPDLAAARQMVQLLRARGADTVLRDGAGRDAPALAAALRPADGVLIDELQAPLAMPGLPTGWLEAFDPHLNRRYYFHARSKEARWEIPAAPIAA